MGIFIFKKTLATKRRVFCFFIEWCIIKWKWGTVDNSVDKYPHLGITKWF